MSGATVFLLGLLGLPGAGGISASGGPAGPPAVQATRGNLRETVELKGTLVPAEADEMSLWLDEYKGELVVLEALPEGSPVNRGDVLVRLDRRRLDEQIQTAEFELGQKEARHRQAREQAQLAAAASRDELARAVKQNDWAQRRLAGYLEHEKAHRQESERLRTQSEQHRLEDQRDELAQLEKMYKEDELVDATEEIVLKRSRRSLARYQASVDLQRRIRAYRRQLDDVIKQEELELGAAQKASALERQRRSLEVAAAARRLEEARARRDLGRRRRTLERLQADREKMVVRAPRRGILLHGEAGATPGAAKLKRGRTLRPRQVFATVAAPDRFKVAAQVPEAEVFRARTGAAAIVKVKGLDALELVGSLRVAPLATGRDAKGHNVYEAEVALSATDPRLRPRLKCTVTVILEEAKNAVLIPAGAVVKRHGVAYVKCGPRADGPFEERRVVLGCRDRKHVVVKDGVREGEFVLVPGKEGK